METQVEIGELVNKSDILALETATWDQPRTTEQLLSLISRREADIFSTQS
ncbi:MAG: hypothetical protein WCH58_04560 [Candidatus Saccharibacteria bacterium]